jgi:hypothetical protein
VPEEKLGNVVRSVGGNMKREGPRGMKNITSGFRRQIDEERRKMV